MQKSSEPLDRPPAPAAAVSRWKDGAAAPAHRTRRTILEKEATWRLGEDALERVAPGDAVRRIPYAEIAALRLSYDPMRFEASRYRCDVVSKDSRRERIVSVSYVSLANFENRSATYVPFVRALAARVAEANPSCRFLAGKRRIVYVAEQVFLLLMLLFLVSVLYLTGVPIAGLVAIQLVLIAVYVPVMIRYTRVNRPRRFDPAAIPADLMPVA